MDPLIRVQDLTFRFDGATDPALSHVDLTVGPGEFVVLNGPSGCGKSTLALAIAGFLFHGYEGEASGNVTVAGLDARAAPIFEIAEHVGLVQQNPEGQFCTLTVLDELAFGLENRRLEPAEIRDRIDWAASIVGATHLLGRDLATLSGGEQQRVAVAAMMAAKPDVLIFDEPTASLDPAATAEVFDVIDRIREKAGIAVVVIEHKLAYLRRYGPRLVTMDAGRVMRDGAFEEAPDDDGDDGERDPGGPRAGGEPVAAVVGLRLEIGGEAVVEGLDLTIRAGEIVALMGDNGAGKTSVLLALLGLLRPAAGQVVVAGKNTREERVSALARHVGFVFQNPDHQIVESTVAREVGFGPRVLGLDAGERVDDLLRRLDLQERRDEHPHRLSHGQKRRLNLATALAHDPDLLVLDELLVGQDPASADRLMDLVKNHAERGGATLMAIHDPAIVRRHATRVVILERGPRP